LLVLAASTYQVPAIRAAKARGYRVLTTDNAPANVGHALADANFDVDTTDLSGVLELAIAERVDGIISPGTDVAVETAAYVAERLGLPGPGTEAARLLTRKRHFRQLLQRSGLPCPRLIEPDDVASAATDGDCRWIVKPNRSSGSKGVFVARDAAELSSRIDESATFSLDGEVVVEEFIEGTQHTCEGWMRDGRLSLALLTDRDTVALPHTATSGHRVPTRLSRAQRDDAIAAIEHVLRMVSVSDGPVDCDFVAASGCVFLIEMTPRLGGNSLSQLFAAALECDLVSAAVGYACGDEVDLGARRAPAPAAIMILGAERKGRLSWDTGQARSLSLEPWVSAICFDVAQGESVDAFTNGRHRVGEVLVTASSRDDLDAKLADVKRRLNLFAH
jgi:biotin carboxylase